MRFGEFPGLESEKRKLTDMVRNGRLGHAHLFASNEGGSAFPLALAFATYLNCEDRGETDSCGTCPSCQKMKKLIHPDLHFSFPISTTEKFKNTKDIKCEFFLNSWREFIAENPFPSFEAWADDFIKNEKGSASKNLSILIREAREIVSTQALSRYEGKYKVFLIWNSERLNDEAANTLLKVLEEPTDGTIFILVTHKLDSHLKTMLSRLQIHSFPPLASPEVSVVLQEKYSIQKDISDKSAALSGGSISEALHISGNPNRVDFEQIQAWFRACFSLNYSILFQLAEEFSRARNMEKKSYFLVALKVLENSIHSGNSERMKGWNQNLLSFFSGFKKNVPLENFDPIRKDLEEGLYLLERNIQARLLFLQLSIKLNRHFTNRN